jgi:hypothetical protein
MHETDAPFAPVRAALDAVIDSFNGSMDVSCDDAAVADGDWRARGALGLDLRR